MANDTLTHLNWKDMEKQPTPGPKTASKRIVAGVCGIVLGALGLHKFILGYGKEGLIMMLVSVLSFGFAAPIMGLVGLIEGIIYLTKPDDVFVQVYQISRRGWF